MADSIGSHLPTISLARKRFAVFRLEHREILCGISARWADLDGALRTKLPEGSYNPALLPHADAEKWYARRQQPLKAFSSPYTRFLPLNYVR